MAIFRVSRLADEVVEQAAIADDEAFDARHAADAQSRAVIEQMRDEGRRRAYAMAVGQLEAQKGDARRFEPDELSEGDELAPARSGGIPPTATRHGPTDDDQDDIDDDLPTRWLS